MESSAFLEHQLRAREALGLSMGVLNLSRPYQEIPDLQGDTWVWML